MAKAPEVCPLPDGDCFSEFLLAWKQDNNGSTFIASPVPLPWLIKYSVDYIYAVPTHRGYLTKYVTAG